VRIARRAQPGNWLRPSSEGLYSIYFMAGSPQEGLPLQLPSLKQEGC
jgi:hypothetical protein